MFLDILVYGFIQSSALVLMAFGFSLVYGVSRLPNFAHGAIYVLTGFVAWVFLQKAGLPYPVAAGLAIAASGLLGVIIYYVVLRRVRGMEVSEVIATYAIGLAVLEGLRYAGFRGTSYSLPNISDGVVFIFDVPVDHQRVWLVVLGFAMLAAIWLLTRYTRVGRALKGMAQDERAAMMLGIDSDRTAALAVGLGSMMAGVAALIIFPLGSLVVEEGYKVLIYAIAVCVVGGLGSWAGTVIAAFVLGYSQYITVSYGKPHFQMVVMLLAIIATLIVRPSGFFGKQKQLEERV
jgi:branched-chain amino acid transport system permease protein